MRELTTFEHKLSRIGKPDIGVFASLFMDDAGRFWMICADADVDEVSMVETDAGMKPLHALEWT